MSNMQLGHSGSLEKLEGAATEAVSPTPNHLGYQGAVADTGFGVVSLANGVLAGQIKAAALILNQVASAARLAASDLNRSSPSVSKMVGGFAGTVDNYAVDLQGQTAEQLVRAASSFTRRQPALVFGIAALAGFLGFRLVKSATPTRNVSSGPERENFWKHNQGPYGRSRSAATRQHFASSTFDETPDGLNALEESLRQAAEDIPAPEGDDIPVFDRGTTPPRI